MFIYLRWRYFYGPRWSFFFFKMALSQKSLGIPVLGYTLHISWMPILHQKLQDGINTQKSAILSRRRRKPDVVFPSVRRFTKLDFYPLQKQKSNQYIQLDT